MTKPVKPHKETFSPSRKLRLWIAGDSLVITPGWAIVRAWRRPLAVWPTGVVIWVVTVVVGMLLRLVAGQGVQFAFVVVATLVLGAFLVGWRVLLEAIDRRATRPSYRRPRRR